MCSYGSTEAGGQYGKALEDMCWVAAEPMIFVFYASGSLLPHTFRMHVCLLSAVAAQISRRSNAALQHVAKRYLSTLSSTTAQLYIQSC